MPYLSRLSSRSFSSPGLWPLLLSLVAVPAMAQNGEKSLKGCAEIGPAADRLACYDQLAGRAVSAPVPPHGEAPAPTSLLAPKDEPAPGDSGGLMSKYWELDAQDKRGTFNLTGYRPNYVLPMHLTSRINRAPRSPTQAAVSSPAYRKAEAKFQLSLRTKVVQDVGLADADVWLAFTQQVLWQIWNGKDSKPFRNTDYEPELIYVVPTPKSLRQLPFGWQWRYSQLVLAHQSNGQSDPLSRSWNRLYLGAGFERGDWSLSTRFSHRLSEDFSSDNNPDLVDYRGRGELQLDWTPGRSTASLLYRSTLQNRRFGALQFEWTYPVFGDQPNGVRWFVQAFQGYGETLTDYNFRQTSFGAGVTFMQF